MTTLPTDLRNRLEKVVAEARDIAETGAKSVLEAFAVHYNEPYSHMSPEQRKLRNHLRARARNLGDRRDPNTGTQAIEHLIIECAYEQWHRMLFARFLAENHLLIEPELGVAITLNECEELAKEEGGDLWTLAGRYAQRMLPQIFRADDPLLEISFAMEDRNRLEELLNSLPKEVFKASDSLGWVYQFWQSKRKKQVNESGVKIGADELPAVTQLFTEPYMVSFLLDNSFGAWRAARILDAMSDEALAKADEAALREACSLPGVPLEYLRFVRGEDGEWTPASGTFDSWPNQLSELKVLDPCCGSGHFLVAAFLMLVPMRMEMDGLSAQDAVDSVLQDNLHGLEIDQRCVELAAFALALTAWRFPGAGGYRSLPELNVACSGLAINAKKDEWLDFAGDNTNLRLALDGLYEQFRNAPVLGSLINPETSLSKGSLFELKWEEVGPLLTRALAGEKDDEKAEIGVVARGIAHSASILTNRFHHIFTNPPYLTIKKQASILKNYCELNYPTGKHDVATTFLLRLMTLMEVHGNISIVLPQNWTFQPSYKAFRKSISTDNSIGLISRLGAGAFDSISGEIVKVVLLLLNTETNSRGWYSGIDVSHESGTVKKAEGLTCFPITKINIGVLNESNDYVIRQTDGEDSSDSLSAHSISMRGIVSGDNDKWTKKFFEVSNFVRWRLYQGTPGETAYYAGKTNVIDWSDAGNGMLRPGSKNEAYGRKGVAVGQIGNLPATLFQGELYDNSTGVLIPHNESFRTALWTYLSSHEYSINIREIDQALKVTNATLVKATFDLEHWTKVAKKKYPNGLPKPYSDDPIQWVFHGHPCSSVVWDDESKWTVYGPLRADKNVLQVAVARLLGYRWPAELDPDMELSDEARELVRKCGELLPFADQDGIVCIPAIRGEQPAADRLRVLLAAAYGSEWSPAKEKELIVATGSNAVDLDDWLRNDFFDQHCKLFHHRPFIWHVWDGRKQDGFHALVNYHKLATGGGKGTQLLRTLTYSYLGDWITRQKSQIQEGVGGAEDRLAAAQELQKRLESILEGEVPFDIFVRWKAIEEQPVGWEPYINDGVRFNIRPFMTEDIPGGKRGAGILRTKPNIHWKKDRGKDVESAPWFGKFDGDRINDHHLTLEGKQRARDETGK